MNTDDYPLITAASVVTAVTLLIRLLLSLGVPIPAETQDVLKDIALFAAPWIVVLWGHFKTTPLSKPEDRTGEPLVRKSDGMPTEQQVRSMARGR